MTTAQRTPGPWNLVAVPRTYPGDKRQPCYLVARDRGDGVRQYMRNDSSVSLSNHGSEYLFTSPEQALAAIAAA